MVRLTLTVTLSNITRRWLETSQSGYHMPLTVYQYTCSEIALQKIKYQEPRWMNLHHDTLLYYSYIMLSDIELYFGSVCASRRDKRTQ